MSITAARPARTTKAPPRTAEEPREKVNVFGPKARPLWAAGGLLAASAAMDDLPGWPGVVGMAGAAALTWPAMKVAVKVAARFRPDAAARRVAALVACSSSWLSGASLVDWSVEGTGTWIALGSLAAGMGVFGYGPRRWFGGAAEVAAPVEPTLPTDTRTPEQILLDGIRDKWTKEVASDGILKGAMLEVKSLKLLGENGKRGFRGRIELPLNAADEDAVERAVTRVARAWHVGVTSVAINVDPNNAAMASVLVLKVNPLWQIQPWTGSGIEADGRAVVGRYMGGDDMVYRFWDEGGAWHDLISGATRAGKSEEVNLLLVMEIRSGVVASYLIDPQKGQSFAELTDLVAGYAKTMETTAEHMGIREMLRRVEAEMYRRNAELATQTYIDDKGRLRRGIKNWSPTPTMPLLVLTVDEAHTILADPECCEIIARLCAMGGKCGIKVRLITQVPLLSSLRRMEIRDAVACGNVFVFRTGNRLSGDVAANGNLPGHPHKLPRRWIYTLDGVEYDKNAAGICYSVGAGSVPEMGRTLLVEDFYGELFTSSGRPRYPRVAVDLPDEATPALPVAGQVPASGGGDDRETAGCREFVYGLFASRPGQIVLRQEVVEAVGNRWKIRMVQHALTGPKGLVKAGEVEMLGDGQYRLAERV